MVAATQTQSLAITINGNDWSPNLVSFEIGFESYQQGTGLILKKGTLVLCNIRGDSRAIDPIAQNDFDVGNNLRVEIFDPLPLPNGTRKPHPLGYQLKILAPPEVGSINQGIPEVEGNLIVTISVGCNLAYSRTQEADSDQTGVTLGSFIRVSEVVGNLLNAAGISNSSINIDDIDSFPEFAPASPSFPGSTFDLSPFPTSTTVFEINKLMGFIGWTYSKNGGGFTDLAGEFAYSGDYGLIDGEVQPDALFCDFNNRVTLKLIPKLKGGGSYYHEYTNNVIALGVDDRLYQRQLDLSIAPGTVEISGIWRQVKDITSEYPFTDTITNSDGSRTETTFYYAEGEEIPSELKESFLFSPSTGTMPQPSAAQGGAYIYQGQAIISKQTSSENFGLTSTTVTGQEYQFSFYNTDRYLNYEITVRYANAGSLYPSGWEDLGSEETEDIITAATNYKNTLVPSEVVITVFGFTDNYVTQKQTLVYSNLFLVDRTIDFIVEFPWAFNKAPIPGQGRLSLPLQNMAVKQDKVETWREVNERWIYTVKDFSPAIVNNPTLFDEDRATKLALSPKLVIPSTTTIKARDTQPPAIVYWEGKFKIKENQVNGFRVFGNGENNKNIRLQSPFWFPFVTETSGIFITERQPLDQPDAFARIEGEIINGRQYQYIIECEPSIFDKVYEPLVGVTVVEINTTKYFLADALTWYHTPTNTYVSFAGIFAGSSITPPPGYAYPDTPGDVTPPSDPGDPGTIPESFPNQIIATPSPTATIEVAGVAFIDTITGSAER